MVENPCTKTLNDSAFLNEEKVSKSENRSKSIDIYIRYSILKANKMTTDSVGKMGPSTYSNQVVPSHCSEDCKGSVVTLQSVIG